VTAEDFELTISSVEEMITFSQSKYFIANAELKNISERDIEITYMIIFWPSIPNWSHLDEFDEVSMFDMPAPQSVLLKPNDILQGKTMGFGRTLETGTHELRVGAIFWPKPLEELSDREEQMVIHSNPITLTVLPAYEQPPVTAEDFELIISVEEATLPQGENFAVNVELKNNSYENLEITHGFLFWPNIPNWHIFSDMGVEIDIIEQQRLFESGSILQNVGMWGEIGDAWRFGSTLEVGTHELRFRALFYLNWGNDNQQQIEILSNVIIITVLPAYEQPPLTADDFELIIWAEEDTLTMGENFKVNFELKNNSGQDLRMNYDVLVWPFIPDWCLQDDYRYQWIPLAVADVMHHRSRIFEADGVLRNIKTFNFNYGSRSFGATLTPGTHELTFRALFTLNQMQPNRQVMSSVISNTIILTVQ